MVTEVLENIRWQLAHASACCVTLTREQGERLLQFAEHNTHAFKAGEITLRVNGAVFEASNERQRAI